MKNNKTKNLAAIILAAGRGKRMKVGNINKSTLLLNGKPLIAYPVNLFEKSKIDPIFIVVGYGKHSIKSALKNSKVVFVEQTRPLGTGQAAMAAIEKIPSGVTDVIVLYGDDSYLYNENLLNKIIKLHFLNDSSLTFLTIKVHDANGLGRIVRNDIGEVTDIVEEKDATPEQKKIKEINPNCYIFRSEFLRKYLPKLPKSPVTGEYYLPSLIKLAYDNNEKIQVIEAGSIPWRGINTREDLEEARVLLEGGRLQRSGSHDSYQVDGLNRKKFI